MAITIKLFSQIVNELIGWAQTHAQEVDDFNDGSTLKTLLESLAFELDFSNLQIEFGQQAQAIDTSSGIDLDLKVADYGVTRKAATAATIAMGLEFTLSAPAPFGGIVIPAGTVVSTPATFNPYDAVEYQTVGDLTIAAGDTSGSIDGIALVAGVAGNQPIGAISVLVTSISGVISVTNTQPAVNGTDAETDAQLRVRGKAAFISVTNDLASSFQAVTLAATGVESVSVVGFGDPLMTRDAGNGGKVDIYFQAPQSPKSIAETFLFNNALSGGDYIFSPYAYAPPTFNLTRNVPVLAITRVKNITTNTIIDPTHYSLVNDVTIFANSDRAKDSLHWLNTAGISNGDEIEVTFTYDSEVTVARIAAETKRGATLDMMVKKGTAVPVNVSLSVNSNKGVDPTVLHGQLVTLLTDFLDAKLLDQDILQAAIVLLVGKFNGVQNVVLPLTKLSISGAGVSDIIVDKAHYVVAGVINVTILPPLVIQ